MFFNRSSLVVTLVRAEREGLSSREGNTERGVDKGRAKGGILLDRYSDKLIQIT